MLQLQLKSKSKLTLIRKLCNTLTGTYKLKLTNVQLEAQEYYKYLGKYVFLLDSMFVFTLVKELKRGEQSEN